MRIVLLNSYGKWQGGEAVFADLAGGLARRGHEVTLVCRRGSPLAARVDEFDGRQPKRAGSASAQSIAGVNAPCLAGAGRLRVETGALRGEANPRSYLEALLAMRRAGAEVLLTNLSRDLKFGAPAARLLGVAHVHRFAEVAPPAPVAPRGGRWRWTRLRNKGIQRRLLRDWVAGCIVPSRYVRDLLLARFPEARPAVVVHNGVDTGRFRPDPEAGLRWRLGRGITAGDVLVGCVGLLDRRRKAQHVLV